MATSWRTEWMPWPEYENDETQMWWISGHVLLFFLFPLPSLILISSDLNTIYISWWSFDTICMEFCADANAPCFPPGRGGGNATRFRQSSLPQPRAPPDEMAPSHRWRTDPFEFHSERRSVIGSLASGSHSIACVCVCVYHAIAHIKSEVTLPLKHIGWAIEKRRSRFGRDDFRLFRNDNKIQF